jgi:hypothetical protein
MQDPAGWNRLGEAVDGISIAIDTMAGSIDGIKDNPAIKSLAFGLQLLSGVKAIASAKNWIEYIVATAGVGASIIAFVSSMKGQSFAGGGIVAPAGVGDQVNIRANPGEMILNHNQQSRLFNIINQGKEQSNNNNVVFRLQGQELVGLINNYTKKHA